MANATWKSYGGTQNIMQNNNTYANDVVCNTLQVKNIYQGTLKINGNLEISGNFDISGGFSATNTTFNDITVYNDISINGAVFANSNLDVSENVITHGRIYVGPAVNNQISPYLTGIPNSTTGNIGINTTSPTSTLDIRGGTQETLNVQSQQSKNRNILAQNTNLHGIVLQTTDVSSGIHFYNEKQINNNVQDAVIRNESGILILDASNSVQIFSPLSLSPSPDLSSSTLHVFQETVTVRDISNTLQYNNNYYNTEIGHAVTMLSRDNSAVTFLHATTPNKTGTQIGGGGYPYDTTRGFGTWGYTDAKQTYVPAQTIVQGQHPGKYRTTTGINTYKPRTDEYVLDVNGPVHITNSSVTITQNLPFEVQSQSFNSNRAIVVGTPSSTQPPYYQKIATSNNSGKTWSLQSIVSGDLLNIPVSFYNARIYNNNYSVIVGSNSLIFVSTDGMNAWNQFILPPTLVGATIFSVDVGTDISNNSFLLVCISKINQPTIWRLNTNSTTINQIDQINKNILARMSQTSPGNYNIYSIGYTDTNPIVNRINGYESTNLNQLFSYSGIETANYTDILVVDVSNVVVVGENDPYALIVYTMDAGTTWYNNQTNTGVLRSVSTFQVGSITLGVAVGDAGLILYCSDVFNPSSTWLPVPQELLNGSGNLDSLTNYNLKTVYMVDIETIAITANVVNFDLSQNVAGKSELFYVYTPALFHSQSNNVIDISGNGTVSGNWTIEQQMAVGYPTPMTWNPSFALDVNGIINGTLNVPSDYRIKRHLVPLNAFDIDELKPYFYFNEKTKRHEIGFVAHEVQALYPFLVEGDKDGEHLQSLNYLGIIGMLVKEVQTLKQTINQQKTTKIENIANNTDFYKLTYGNNDNNNNDNNRLH